MTILRYTFLLLLIGTITSAVAQSFEYLEANKYLFPQGKTEGLYFKGLKQVKLNEKGEVIIGTIVSNAYLFPQGTTEGKYFMGGTQIEFNSKGEVVIGTLANESYLFPYGSTEGKYFIAGCPITFNRKGEVTKGALSKNTYLFPQGSSQGIYFKPGCSIEFNSKGEVFLGTILNNTYLFPQGSSEGKYFLAGTQIEFTSKGEVSNSVPNKCSCKYDIMEFGASAELSKLHDIINGVDKNYDKTVLTVLKRNNWSNILAVVDVTGSMYPYAAQVYLWMKLNQATNQTKYYVFFNDGDGKPDASKRIGATGGLYGTKTNSLDVLLKTMAIAMKNGNGGDGPENDIEAMLYGINKCPECTNIIHVADNNTSPKDIELLYKVQKPVRVIACGVSGSVEPKLLYIAYKTGGSFHTIEEDIRNLSSLSIGETVRVAGKYYRLGRSGFTLTD